MTAGRKRRAPSAQGVPSAIPDPERLGFDRQRLARIAAWMQRYVDAGRFPGSAVLVARRGEIAYLHTAGFRDVDARTPWSLDTLVRIYSMTKPVTAIGLMLLYEEGLVHLDDPVDAFLPEFADLRVLAPGAKSLDDTVPAEVRVTLRHLLTHTSGLTYGFNGDVLGEAYEREELGTDPCAGGLAKVVGRIARLPLAHQPGARWTYGVSIDVIGRVIEVVAGVTLDRYLGERLFGPLGMADTGFAVDDHSLARFAELYELGPDRRIALTETATRSPHRAGQVDTFLGGAGLVSTIADYWRFAEMLRGGGALGDVRILSPRTLALINANHLPGDLAAMGPRTWAETSFEGVGFGLAGWVMLDPARAQMSGSAGDFGWGGMASTIFWVDPKEDLVVVFLTQLVPSSAWPNRKELRALVYGALVG